MTKELIIPFLGPRPSPAVEYFKRAYADEEGHTSESDLLKSIRRVIRPPNSRRLRQTLLYPAQGHTTDEAFSQDIELSWNSCCVVLSAGGIVARKWTFEEEDQDIQWACRGLVELPTGIVEGSGAFFSSTSAEELEASSSNSPAFSRFAESAKARQRAVTPAKRISAVFVFLRSIGKIFTDTGEELTFHLPFLVRRAWPLRPHGVLIQREIGQYEEDESARTGEPLLPTLFSLHDPFAELKAVGLAARIHGPLPPTFPPTAITPVDPNNPPEIKIPEDFADSTSAPDAQPLPPPVLDRSTPVLHPPATDRALWVSEEITFGAAIENIVVTSTAPLQDPLEETHESFDPTRLQSKLHRYANEVHLSIWRYAYLKPREVPTVIPKKKPQGSKLTSRAPSDPSNTATPHRDPEAIRRREWQDRADRVPPSSPPLGAAPPAGFPPPPSSTSLFPPPRQPPTIQPTLASLPGGELPASWTHPFQNQPHHPQGHERQSSQDQLPTGVPQQSPRARTEILENDDDIATRMDASHKKNRPYIWLEQISAIPIPPKE